MEAVILFQNNFRKTRVKLSVGKKKKSVHNWETLKSAFGSEQNVR
jgi:hypothetical protein